MSTVAPEGGAEHHTPRLRKQYVIVFKENIFYVALD